VAAGVIDAAAGGSAYPGHSLGHGGIAFEAGDRIGAVVRRVPRAGRWLPDSPSPPNGMFAAALVVGRLRLITPARAKSR
jgi:hypothetical protein